MTLAAAAAVEPSLVLTQQILVELVAAVDLPEAVVAVAEQRIRMQVLQPLKVEQEEVVALAAAVAAVDVPQMSLLPQVVQRALEALEGEMD